ncbi:hypothetical protein CO112_03240 [Candidatus Dojkabacteria bacterium CG_4_9_14_3_um_filter_150_Dojkabacteria_WS6_41_13]|uniref:HD/PDEase domain-containing protein n=1 Tax=Candidatus Dojkabacteria bacterium CG_4_10_14_0_2_um_filter_Dojkabacteria_WS6_41_15 TaxID=2014249 RepID=A0A2M7W0R1_9BACT|nr:MAG: hypothetical protein COX64_04870 [Candidatus Dojkabacteria bacterium CG_4_10_14_0_2_um_filter_Dojkabacteria_WS6_41_15]PJB22632.1 MAG: hypothetical protein CO112_03240 [Candidatus Dojkabacteria bacterium CG_4_9_14_3_um_filter_150_Dojkabacteria_WS6_41_13]
MAKTLFIEDIKPSSSGFDEIFTIKEIQKHKAKNGDPYFRVVLQDKTGTVQSKIWRDAIVATNAENLVAGDVIKTDFEASEFNGELQLTLKKAEKTTDFDLNDLVRMTTKDLDSMYKQLIEKLESLKDAEIRGVLLLIAKDPEISNKLKHSIAAIVVHHDFVGGLLEHILEMFAIGETIVTLYPRANRSIVIAGIFLHDIGKISELAVEQTRFVYTTEGSLIGHIMIGIQLLEKFLPPDFSPDKKLALEHIILSHHREPEFGAVVRPATLEAIIVSMADLASNVTRQFQKELDEGREDEAGFGDFHKFMKSRIYHKEIAEEE